MNERDRVQPNNKSSPSATKSSPKPVINQSVEHTDPIRNAQRSEPREGASCESSAASPEAHRESAKGTTGTRVRIEHQHSLATRWMHWLNFPLLVVMIYSGVLIYWADSQHEGLNAHRVYHVGFGSWTLFRLFPPWFYNNLHLKFQLAKGLGYHFFFMWFFALNGMAYVLYTFFSGEWRGVLAPPPSFLGIKYVTFFLLGFKKDQPPRNQF